MCVFGWWGLFTVAGRQQFDEMAGMIPLIAGCAGIGVGLLAVILFAVSAGHLSNRK
jgi:hypothetical protein